MEVDVEVVALLLELECSHQYSPLIYLLSILGPFSVLYLHFADRDIYSGVSG
jgi:hypothetical protein